MRNLKGPHIPDHPSRILITGGSGSGKINTLLNLTNYQPDIDNIYLYAKGPYESIGLKHFNDRKVFIEYSNDT